MRSVYSDIGGNTLRQRIKSLPEDSGLFRSAFPDYHSEFVGGTLSELSSEGVLVKLAHGIYARPRKSRFGVVLPSMEKIVQAISKRDNANLTLSCISRKFIATKWIADISLGYIHQSLLLISRKEDVVSVLQ